MRATPSTTEQFTRSESRYERFEPAARLSSFYCACFLDTTHEQGNGPELYRLFLLNDYNFKGDSPNSMFRVIRLSALSKHLLIKTLLVCLLFSWRGWGMRCSTGRIENGLCGSVWYQ